MADVARKAGVAQATVSMALRNHPEIPPETRDRIRAIAQEIGYRPNPLVSALMAQLHTSRTSDEAPAIAYLNPTRGAPHSKGFRSAQRCWNGAVERARQLGYHLEEFWLFEPGMTPERMTALLHARGIVAVVIAMPGQDVQEIRLDWSGFAVVSIGRTLAYPRVHRVSTNHYQNMSVALENLERLGYRRIGLAMTRIADALVSHVPAAAFAGYQQWIPDRFRVPPYFPHDWNPWDEDAFKQWLGRRHPEVVICSDHRKMNGRLKEAGYRIPKDISMVTLDVDGMAIPCAGIDQNSELVGAAAVDVVVGQLHRNERGIPSTPQAVTIEGRWVDGPTVVR